MNVIILATKDCSHRPMLERKLNEMNVNYDLKFLEDDQEALEKYKVHGSPNLVVNNEIVFLASPTKSLPSDNELKKIIFNQ